MTNFVGGTSSRSRIQRASAASNRNIGMNRTGPPDGVICADSNNLSLLGLKKSVVKTTANARRDADEPRPIFRIPMYITAATIAKTIDWNSQKDFHDVPGITLGSSI